MDLYEVDKNGYILEEEQKDVTPESSYFITITSEVLYDKRLNSFQKILFACISGLCRRRGYCWAPNSYFEKELNKSESNISQSISKLVELGYLKRKIIYKKKYNKEGKIIKTKEVAFRKLMIVFDSSKNHDEDRGILEFNDTRIFENEDRGILENEKVIINNKYNINNNINTISKDIGKKEFLPNIEAKNNINNITKNEIFSSKEEEQEKNVIGMEVLVGSKVGKETAPAARRGLGPLIEIIREKYDFKKDEEIVTYLMNYLRCHLGCRRLPDENKWRRMLEDLEIYSSIKLPGTEGVKFLKSRAIEIIQRAINEKKGFPYLEFDNIYNIQKSDVMEPQFKENQDSIKGY